MKKYKLTDAKKARALSHARRLAAEKRGIYDGRIEIWFNPQNNEFSYSEIIGQGYCTSDTCIYVDSVRVWGF